MIPDKYICVYLLPLFGLPLCFRGRVPTRRTSPPGPRHFLHILLPSDGKPVSGAPEPEVVQLVKIEDTGIEKHVTVGNIAGDYVLVCNLDVNKPDKSLIRSCLSPQPQKNYLLFRENTKWRVAQDPLTLKFFQDFSVSYNNAENIALMLAKRESGEEYGVYWLQSWTARVR